MLLVSFLLGWFFHWFWSSMDNGGVDATTTNPFSHYKKDDLKIVEGIGPKIAELLQHNNIATWEQLAATDITTLKYILSQGGERFAMHDPSSWADQASLAAQGKWADLREYQDLLIGGRTL